MFNFFYSLLRQTEQQYFARVNLRSCKIVLSQISVEKLLVNAFIVTIDKTVSLTNIKPHLSASYSVFLHYFSCKWSFRFNCMWCFDWINWRNFRDCKQTVFHCFVFMYLLSTLALMIMNYMMLVVLGIVSIVVSAFFVHWLSSRL